MFTLPNFNLRANVWHGLWPANEFGAVFPTAPPGGGADLNVACQLYQFSRQLSGDQAKGLFPVPDFYLSCVSLRVPALTDLRDVANASKFADVVECPAFSGRWYVVGQVDDCHKGFPNEYRIGVLTKVFAWPSPIP